MISPVLVATRSGHKLREIRQILAEVGGPDLMDLEAAGVVQVVGDRDVAADVVRFVTAELALNPWMDADMVRVTGVAGELEPLSYGRLYPDANSTLRVGFGQVKGYAPKNAVWYLPQTDVRGIIQKETGVEPFSSPKRLLERAEKREFGTYIDEDLKWLPVAYISTNIVTNGSSGSVTMNAWGELCGLAFDSNWEGVGSDFMVEEDIARTIHVDSRYMLWVMDAVDGAHNLLREMGITPQFAE